MPRDHFTGLLVRACSEALDTAARSMDLGPVHESIVTELRLMAVGIVAKIPDATLLKLADDEAVMVALRRWATRMVYEVVPS